MPGTVRSWRWVIGLAALGPLAWGLQAWCATDPEWTERVYAQGVFPTIARGLVACFGWVPFSVAETLLLVACGWVGLRIWRGMRAWRQRARSLLDLARSALLQALAVFGALFMVFQLVWGLNHARRPFATHVGLEVREVTASELAAVVEDLGRRAAARRPESDDRAFLAADWRERVGDAYDAAGTKWPVLAGPRPSIRAPWISRLMVLGSITGIYSPFTGEPHVSDALPERIQPFVACHEVAHLRGFAREDEANFIAWWVGSRSPDPALAYSAELQAYRHALGRLRGVDFTLAHAVWERTPEPVRADVNAIRAFWKGQPRVVHETLSVVTEAFNDAYLRSSGHRDGVRSYGRMVDLLVAALAEE